MKTVPQNSKVLTPINEDYVSALADMGNAIKYHNKKAVTTKNEL